MACAVHLCKNVTEACPDVNLHLVPLRQGLSSNLELDREPATPSDHPPPPTDTSRVTDTRVDLASHVGPGIQTQVLMQQILLPTEPSP